MTNNNTQNDLIQKIQMYLSYRDHSEYELEVKLLKHFNKPDILKAITIAKQNKWMIDPLELAQKFADTLHQKNKGWLFIKLALQKKRLPIIQKNESQEEEKCQKLINKKFDTTQLSSLNITNKIYRFLSYRGFESETIIKVIQKYKK